MSRQAREYFNLRSVVSFSVATKPNRRQGQTATVVLCPTTIQRTSCGHCFLSKHKRQRWHQFGERIFLTAGSLFFVGSVGDMTVVHKAATCLKDECKFIVHWNFTMFYSGRSFVLVCSRLTFSCKTGSGSLLQSLFHTKQSKKRADLLTSCTTRKLDECRQAY